MSRGSYGQGKRQRDAEKARKKRDKADRRAMRRDQGPREIEVVSADHMTGALPTADEAIKAMDDRSASGRSAASIPCRLFVGGLSWDTTIESLTEAFTKFGAVVEAVIVKDRDTGRSRGFGFVVMEDRKDASKVLDGMDGSELDGRRIVVNVATERKR